MTPGADVMWYPYAAMFSREVDELVIEVKFDTPVRFVRGYVASLDEGTCRLSSDQPSMVGQAGDVFTWTINPVNNQEIYALVFER
jgi:hypothetical protein